MLYKYEENALIIKANDKEYRINAYGIDQTRSVIVSKDEKSEYWYLK